MKFSLFSCLVAVTVLIGCGQPDASPPDSGSAPSGSQDATVETPAEAADDGDETTAAEAGGIAITPENTTIQFVGTHADPEKPDPRTGRFKKFDGTAVVDGSALKSVTVEIDTLSLTTDIEKLTGHLKSPDFFNVNEHPTATFTSTAIEPGEGAVTITGDLTLLGQTKSISFPANVSTDDGLKLNAEFEIDRTEFGMDFGPDKILKEVQMTITVGG